jgi:tetratricopeptide (TPR) repeat protein
MSSNESDSGLEILRRAYESARDRLGQDHLDTLKALADLSLHDEVYGELQTAIQGFECVFERLERRDDESEFRSDIELALGRILLKVGRIDEAASHFAAVIQQSTRTAQDQVRRHTAAAILADLLRSTGEFERELALRQQLVELCIHIFGTDDTRTLHARSDLGTSYRQVDDYEHAYEIDMKVLEAFTKSMADQRILLGAMRNVANDLRGLKRFSESADLFQDVFDRAQRDLAPNDPFRIEAVRNRKAYRRLARMNRLRIFGRS